MSDQDSKKAKPTPADERAAERLRALWDAAVRARASSDRKLTQTLMADVFAESTGKGTQGLISQYLGGKIPLNHRAVLLFAGEIGCEPTAIRDDLPEFAMHGAGSRELGDDADWPPVLGYAQAVGLGSGAEAAEYEETHKLKFRADSLHRKGLRPDKLAVVYGKGDSMLPRIHSGDAILFDKSDTNPSDDALFVIAMEGAAAPEYNVKRCEIIDEDVFFRADNPAGDHNWRRAKNMHNKRNPIKIIGRVRWIGSWED